jgi:spectinomycin phosphotransferase
VDLLRWVREDFGIRLIGARPTGLGADARAATFGAQTADGAGYAVKTSTAPQPGLAVAHLLAPQGVPGVPAPVRTLDGDLTASRRRQAADVTACRDHAAYRTGL